MCGKALALTSAADVCKSFEHSEISHGKCDN
jgi:hypothetical protein